MRVKKESMERGVVIDLTGPEGNAFCLLGYAQRWAEAGMAANDTSTEVILKEMQSDDYENLVNTLEYYFGHFITLME